MDERPEPDPDLESLSDTEPELTDLQEGSLSEQSLADTEPEATPEERGDHGE